MKQIDLHIHTTASDGTFTPEEAARYAAQKGLAAIAITDHDTAAGAVNAAALGAKYGLEVIPGIELSTDYLDLGVHILGYFIDPQSPALNCVLEWVIEERRRRNGEIAGLMRRDGVDVSLDSLCERFPGTVIGRPHFAAVLVEQGRCRSVDEAFARYLSPGMRYYRERRYMPVREAFDVIRKAGGKAVFAHPFQYRLPEPELLELTRCLTECGCVGMECLYSGYSKQQSDYLMDLAARFGLCVTGGSDFHGKRKPHIDMGSGTGELCVPYELLERLREAR